MNIILRLSIAGCLAGLIACTKSPAGDTTPHPQGEREFEGASVRGDLVEALNKAIRTAQTSGPPDARVTWTLKRISGQSGTIAGINEIKVVIGADISR
jgi:hypothetical protein